MNKLLNRDQLKFLVIIPMTLSHIGDIFLLPDSIATASFFYLFFNIIGHVTAPTMCLMLAKGYEYTRNRWKYFGRILLFALISHVPHVLCHHSNWIGSMNMFFTLAIGLLALICYDSIENKFLKYGSITLLVFLTVFCEWAYTAVLWILIFYIFRDDKKKMFIFAMLVFVEQMIGKCNIFHIQFGDGLAVLIPYVCAQGLVVAMALYVGMFCCSGERGKHPKFMKWFFYIYYPFHFFAIYIATLILK